MNTINSGFIGDFKLGDNVNHNLAILKLLYSYCEINTQSKSLLNKPIIIIIVSIIEVLLYDFHLKANLLTREGIKNVSNDALDYIRDKQIDNFNKYIDSAKKHKLFGVENQYLYDDLAELRKLRNRIHIQNEKNYFERDESVTFSNKRKILAEKALEKIMKIMSKKHQRGLNYVDDFVLPWQPHFES